MTETIIEQEDDARSYCFRICGEEAMGRLDRFIALLAEENERQNLISRASLQSVWQRHIADSLQLLELVPRGTAGPWLDLGTGAGFPGLAIGIARPDMDVVLIESRKKRVAWLDSVAERFSLDHCRVIGERLQSVESFPAAVISARAFAPLDKLLRLSARFSTRETIWLLPKGRSGAQQLAEQPEALSRMFHVEQSRTDPQAGIVTGQGRPELR